MYSNQSPFTEYLKHYFIQYAFDVRFKSVGRKPEGKPTSLFQRLSRVVQSEKQKLGSSCIFMEIKSDAFSYPFDRNVKGLRQQILAFSQ